MKIIAVGRNYTEHAKELNNPLPTQPVIFLKPDTALLRENRPFYLPSFSNDIHHEVEVVIKISKEGKHIQEKFANKYFEEVSVGIDFTARDIQQQQKEKGLPWEIAKAFDRSSPVGEFIKITDLSQDIHQLDFSLLKNGMEVQKGNTKDMIFSFEKIIVYISSYFTLKKGDMIFTGTPAGVGKVDRNDRLEAFIGNKKVLDFEIK
jgi:acylpyruvate hydrolase